MTKITHPGGRLVLRPGGRFLAMTACAALALGLVFSAAAVLVGVTLASELRIEPAILAVGDLPAGTTTLANIRIQNVSGRTIRVVGMESCCSRWGCFDSSVLPIAIRPSEWGVVPIKLKTASKGSTGDFTEDIVIYTDSHRNGRMVAHLAGRVVSQERTPLNQGPVAAQVLTR